MGAVVNSNRLDYCPFVDWSGKNFYFTSERVGISDKKTESVKEIEELAEEYLTDLEISIELTSKHSAFK